MRKRSRQESTLCLWKTDWPWHIVTRAAAGLGFLLERMTFGFVNREPSPVIVALFVALAFDAPLIIVAALQGNAIPNPQDGMAQLLEDWMALALAILAPLAAAIAFQFYRQFYPTLAALRDENVIIGKKGEFEQFLSATDSRCNSILLAVILQAIALLLYWAWAWLPSEIRLVRTFGEGVWIADLPLWLKAYGSVWVVMLDFSLLFFVAKAVIVWTAVRDISARTEKSTAGLKFAIDLRHRDRAGGLSLLSGFWLRVNYQVVIVGIVVFGVLLQWKPWNEPVYWLITPAYVFFAPLLFFAPFVRLHTLMKTLKRAEVERCSIACERSGSRVPKRAASELEEARRLPTWPIALRTRRLFWLTYVLPYVISFALPVWERLLRKIWGDE